MQRLAALAAVVVVSAGSPARGQSWNVAGSGDWNTNANWFPAVYPNSTSASVSFFNVGANPTINISASVSAQSLTYYAGANSYNITSSAGQTLSGVTSIVLNAGVNNTQFINLANNAAGNLLFPSGNNLFISDNYNTGNFIDLILNSNTVIGSPGFGAISVSGTGISDMDGSFASGANQVTGGLSKYGAGTFFFSGNGTNLGGGLSVNGGTMVLQYTNPASKLGSGTLGLGSGILQLLPNAGTPVTQIIPGGTTVSYGQTDVQLYSVGSVTGTVTLAAGSITRSGAGTVDFSPKTSGSAILTITTTTGTTNGLLGTGPAFATVGGGSTWATVSGGAIAGLTSFGTNTYGSGVNTDVTAGAAPVSFTTNSLRFNSSQTLNLTGSNTLQSGGILVTPNAGTVTISGGTLVQSDLIVHQYGAGPLIINSNLIVGGNLVKTGPGTLTLTGNNPGLTGLITVSRGGLAVTNTGAINSASGILFNDARVNTSAAGLQQFVADLGNNVNGTITPLFDIAAFSPPGATATAYGTVFSTGVSTGSRVTLAGTINSIYLNTSIRFTGSTANTSGFNLTNPNNAIFGNISLFQGYLGITSDSCLGNASNNLILDTLSSTAGGLEFLNTGVVVNHPVIFNSTSRIVSDGSDINVVAGNLSSTSSSSFFVKAGTGTLTVSGSNSQLTGGMSLNGGTLILDYSSSATSKLGGGALILGGGVFALNANPGTPFTQTIAGGTFVNPGHTDVQARNSGTITLGAGSITHNLGGTVDFALTGGPTFTVTTSTNNFNGLLGSGPAFATVDGGSTWATYSGGTVAGLPAGNYSANTYSPSLNTDVTITSLAPASFTTNSLRFNTTALSLALTGTNTLQSGGILITPNSSTSAITGGTLTATSSGELLVHDYSLNPFTISSALVSSTGLTKTGPGTLTLSGTNSGLTGPINVNRGGLTVTNIAAISSASAINFNDARPNPNGFFGLQQFTVDLGNGVNGAYNGGIFVSAFGGGDYGTYFSTGNSVNSTVTLSGPITSPSGTPASIRFYGVPQNNNGFNLTGSSTFTGNISLYQGSLGINSDAALGNPNNVLTLDVADLANGGLVFLNTGITVARPVVLNSTTRVVSNGSDSNTIAGQITGGSFGPLVKDGAGTLTLTNANNTFAGGVVVSAGTLSLGATGSLASGSNVTVSSGATFIPNSGSGGIFGAVTLNGGTFRVPPGTGLFYLINQLVTGTSGGSVTAPDPGAQTVFLVDAGSTHGSITINGNSNWLSTGNGTTIDGGGAADIPITIALGATLTNTFPLTNFNNTGFRIAGGGTLFQNTAVAYLPNMTAPLTVASGARFRVVDAITNGFGDFGTGTFTLDGGSFAYGGPTAAITKPIALTGNGGTIEVENSATTLTANAPIAGPGPLTKIGPGTLVLSSFGNSFTNLTINAGTVQTFNDLTLGSGMVTIGPIGVLNATGSFMSGRTFIMNAGTLSVVGGATLTLNGATVGGGFLRGPGTFAVTGGTSFTGTTTFTSTTITQNGAGAYTNFTNGGAMAIAAGNPGPITMNGFSNEGSGSLSVGAQASLSVADFQTYGTITITPATVTQTFSQTTLVTNTGTSLLSFNGGSRTFVGTPQTAVFPSNWPNVSQRGLPTFVAGIDLNGKNAVVAGGLFVNNGYVEDTTNGGQGTATIVADFGSLVKGAGYFQNTVQTINGGKFQAGNSPGKATFGSFVLGAGGVSNYVFAIDDATGAPGPSPDAAGHVSGWGVVKVIGHFTGGATPGDLTWTATPADKLTVSIETLLNPTTVGVDIAGPMDHFDPNLPYKWQAVEWNGTYAGPADVAVLNASTAFDLAGFANPVAGNFGWVFDQHDHTLSLSYTPAAVPEPGAFALVAMSIGGWLGGRRLSRFPV
jgi:autotransporter-associated beta strand protein